MDDGRPARPTELRIRHTMLKVADVDRSVAFYTGRLGMKLLRRRDSAKERCAYVGYGPELTHHALELIEENGPPGPRSLGNCYGHIALAVPDLDGFCAALKAAGVPFRQDLQPSTGSAANRLAFILDPDGFEVELTEKP